MYYILLSFGLLIAVIQWIKYKTAFISMVKYVQLKNYTPPTDEEMQFCNKQAIRELFKTKL